MKDEVFERDTKVLRSDEIIDRQITHALDSMFPYGEGRVGRVRVEHFLRQIAQVAFTEGRNQALMGLMTTEDVAQHFGVSVRRARALIHNRHERFGVGMRFGASWLIHRDELEGLTPGAKYHAPEDHPKPE